MVLLGAGAIFYFLFFTQQPGETTPFSWHQATRTENSVPQKKSNATKTNHPPVPQGQTLASKIVRGDTISGILGPYLSPPEILHLSHVCQPVFPLSDIRPGHPYVLVLENKILTRFEYEINDEQKLVVTCDPNGFTATRQDIVYEIKREVVQGSIDSNLSLALEKLGQGPSLAVMMEDILGWDVDFGRDIRQGDRFRLMVEKRYRKGQPAGYGHILAIDFHNQDTTIRAFRFTDSKGRTSYFDETGQSMRKAFLKAPLSFTRISSGYANRRFHPILKRWRPHHGVDYAAPRGTPIRSVGDGVVVTKAYDKAAGRYIKIRHARGYETVYNHMSRFARSIRKGVRVKQGQVIGYVGSTGYATGPHLDFRVKRHGSYINPLRMKSPPTNPVPPQDMARFKNEVTLLAKAMNAPRLEDRNPKDRIMEAGAKGDAPPKG
jgi:murein DD-endopeptidase MepM/ murein hydrolase activator NlpD